MAAASWSPGQYPAVAVSLSADYLHKLPLDTILSGQQPKHLIKIWGTL